MTMIDQRLDRLYNNRLAVPHFQQYFDLWVAKSPQARANVPCQLDIAYGAHPAETLDLFFAPQDGKWLIFYHGGYWRSLDKADFSFIAPFLTALGWNVAVVNYALCPTVTLSELMEQCRRSAAWLIRQHQPEQLLVTGHSAGGHIAALLWATQWADYGVDPAAFTGGIALSGLYDLEPLRFTNINEALRLDEAEARRLSPLHRQPTLSAPLRVGVGGDETSEFLRQSAAFTASLAWSGVTGDAVILAQHNHFSVLEALWDVDGALWRGWA